MPLISMDKVVSNFNGQFGNKIAIDANMRTHAILDVDFRKLLFENKGEDFPYTTCSCKHETIGNLKEELKISWTEARNKFECFEKEIGLKYLQYKQEYYDKGVELQRIA